jgi:hypothetical protein
MIRIPKAHEVLLDESGMILQGGGDDDDDDDKTTIGLLL